MRSAVIFIALLFAPVLLVADQEPSWKMRVRGRALQDLDDFLHWSLRNRTLSYSLQEPIEEVPLPFFPALEEFANEHGYFSKTNPLVGKVSKSYKGLSEVQSCLLAISESSHSPEEKDLATAEVLAKVLAYRELRVGDRVHCAVLTEKRHATLVEYEVDQIIELWNGMPAIGLVPRGKGAPILLFRGTDFSLDSKRGWASLMSDIDWLGPGLRVFQQAELRIRSWLQSATHRYEKPRVMGFSLGGALAAYTFFFEYHWMSSLPSYGWNLPGISKKIAHQRHGAHFISYVTSGDVVSKVGWLFGSVYELSLPESLKPIAAHTTLMSAQKNCRKAAVNVAAENLVR